VTGGDSRDRILEALERGRGPARDRPALHRPLPMVGDPVETLRSRLVQNGGRLVRAAAGEWVREVEWSAPLESGPPLYVGAGVTALGGRDPRMPESSGVGQTATTPHALAPLEICVLAGDFAVVENGAVWHVPASPIERAATLLAQHLIVLVESQALVPTLHEAYSRIERTGASFGWLLSGPSKTADIEQALVLGAHGPRTMQLVLLDP
jgi:L-lactate dehydrogenase complex protein LldG